MSEAKKKETEITPITMTDGTIVDFPGKRQLMKETFVEGDRIGLKVSFRNGEQRSYYLPAALVAKAAAHGMSQKYGDEIAGLKDDEGKDADLDDKVLAMDQLDARVQKGEWAAERQAGTAGLGILLRAMVKVTGKSVEGLKTFLAGKTPAQQRALRDSPKYAPVIAEMKAERDAKKAPVDTSVEEVELNNVA